MAAAIDALHREDCHQSGSQRRGGVLLGSVLIQPMFKMFYQLTPFKPLGVKWQRYEKHHCHAPDLGDRVSHA
jgi:hypothetical protein